MKSAKISFCTTCMNRLHHLKETLPKNIEDNKDYKNLEFVLLDYNSTDGLEDYVKDELHEFINNGRLVYYKTLTPKYYNASHSRNLSFKLATGDIICNIDADNFTGHGFAKYVSNQFKQSNNIFLSTLKANSPLKKDVLGRVCIRKHDFIKVTGYDEKMVHYGFEDYDLIYRLELNGINSAIIENFSFLQVISHTNKERLANGLGHKALSEVLISYITPASSELLFLYKGNKYKRGTMVNVHAYNASSLTKKKKLSTKYEHAILEENWEAGSWEKINKNIRLFRVNQNEEVLIKNDLVPAKPNSICYTLMPGKNYYVITSELLKEEAHFFHDQIYNRIIMERNLLLRKIAINDGGFGIGEVYKNFDKKAPIILS